MHAISKPQLAELHCRRWAGLVVWLSFTVVFFLAEGVLHAALGSGPLWSVVLLVLLIAHLMHGQLIVFHEAVHRTLCPSRQVNEVVGLVIGTLSFTPLTAFRALHQTHHAHLATERDEELWPFVKPGTPRWLRRLAAAFELCLGIVYTPFLCWRTFLRSGSPVRGQARRRVWLEALLILAWVVVLASATAGGLGLYVLVLYVIPGILAGNMHSWRKYVEHMGLMGTTVLSATRSVVPRSLPSHLFTHSLFNISYHGIHHRYPTIPEARLPEVANHLRPTQPGELPPYPSYWRALRDMFRSLGDPRIGAQWLVHTPSTSTPSTRL